MDNINLFPVLHRFVMSGRHDRCRSDQCLGLCCSRIRRRYRLGRTDAPSLIGLLQRLDATLDRCLACNQPVDEMEHPPTAMTVVRPPCLEASPARTLAVNSFAGVVGLASSATVATIYAAATGDACPTVAPRPQNVAQRGFERPLEVLPLETAERSHPEWRWRSRRVDLCEQCLDNHVGGRRF